MHQEEEVLVDEGNPGITLKFLQNIFKEQATQNNNNNDGSNPPEISSFDVKPGTKPGDNYTSLIYSIGVDLKGSPTRRNLFMKCYPNHPARQQMHNTSNMFFKELEVYKDWFGELRRFQTEVVGLKEEEVVQLPYAPYVYGECIDFSTPEGRTRKSEIFKPLDNYIILEDIRTLGFRMTNRREPLDLDHMKLLINALARVHSIGWAYKHHVNPKPADKFPAALGPFELNEQALAGWKGVFESGLNQAITICDEDFGPGNQYSSAIEGYKKNLGIVMGLYWGEVSRHSELEGILRVKPVPKEYGKDAENPVPWTIVCHGDCWSNNQLYRYDQDTGKPKEVVLVDLQMVTETCVVNDLSYVVYACTDRTFRKNHLNELLQLYHDSFNQCCETLKCPTLPGFSMDSLKFRFHRGKFFGLNMTVMGLPIMLKEEDKVVNLEHMEKDIDMMEGFTTMLGDSSTNQVFKDRLIGIIQDMVEDGVL